MFKPSLKLSFSLIILSCALIAFAMYGMGITRNGIAAMSRLTCSNISGVAWLCAIASAIVTLINWSKNGFSLARLILLFISMVVIAFSMLVIFLIE